MYVIICQVIKWCMINYHIIKYYETYPSSVIYVDNPVIQQT